MRDGAASVLSSLVRSQTGYYADANSGRIVVVGPDVLLNSTATQAIGMALHELSTNTAKYGALSREGGHIEINWQIVPSGDEPMLEIDWLERGGPTVEPPPTRGFGSIVIEAMLAQRLNAVVRYSFEPEGVSWRMRVPLKNIAASENANS